VCNVILVILVYVFLFEPISNLDRDVETQRSFKGRS